MDSTIKQTLFTPLIYTIYIPPIDFPFWTKIRMAEEILNYINSTLQHKIHHED